MDKHLKPLLNYLEKLYLKNQTITKKDLVEKYGQIVFQAKFYDYIEDCGAEDIQITLIGLEKLQNLRDKRKNFVISVLALAAGVCTLIAQLFQLHF